jgi:hypothetical protein
MATVVKKTGIKREKGYLYFIDKNGDVAKTPMKKGKKKAAPKKKSAPKKKAAKRKKAPAKRKTAARRKK